MDLMYEEGTQSGENLEKTLKLSGVEIRRRLKIERIWKLKQSLISF